MIPVLVERRGTVKTTLVELYGNVAGNMITVDNDFVESSFNDWMLHEVILPDELATTDNGAKKMNSGQNSQINSNQAINPSSDP